MTERQKEVARDVLWAALVVLVACLIALVFISDRLNQHERELERLEGLAQSLEIELNALESRPDAAEIGMELAEFAANLPSQPPVAEPGAEASFMDEAKLAYWEVAFQAGQSRALSDALDSGNPLAGP
jgi:hypothetical protein